MRSENRASIYTIKSSYQSDKKKVTPTLEVVQREKGNNGFKDLARQSSGKYVGLNSIYFNNS